MTEKKSWEVPWTPQKIRQNAEKWQLSSDAGLLLYLEQSSSKLSEQFQQTETLLRDLSNALQFTGIRLENTMNDFSMLSNKQFIENRVYDEDVSTLKPPIKKDVAVENAKSKEEREAEMTDAIKFSLQKGCAMINNYFQKIEIRPEDFDEVDDPTFKPDPIYEPKDQFIRRPLPFIIGTSAFENSRYIGLKDDKEQKTNESVSEDEEEELLVVPPPSAKIPNATPSTLTQPDKIIISSSSSIPQLISSSEIRKQNGAGPGSDNSGLFCGSADSDRVDALFPSPAQEREKEKSPVVPDVRQEINQNVAGPSTSKPSAVPRKKPQPTLDDDDLFGPPPLLPNKTDSDDEDKSFFGGGLFKPKLGGGLFDDDDDEDLFTPNLTIKSTKTVETKKPIAETKKSAVTESKTADLFAKKPSVDDLFGSPEKPKVPIPDVSKTNVVEEKPTSAKPVAAPRKITPQSNVLPPQASSEIMEKKQIAESPTPISNSSQLEKIEKKTSIEAPVVSTVQKSKIASIFDDENDDDDDLFRPISKTKNTKKVVEPPKISVQPKPSTTLAATSKKMRDLFFDDDDDDVDNSSLIIPPPDKKSKEVIHDELTKKKENTDEIPSKPVAAVRKIVAQDKITPLETNPLHVDKEILPDEKEKVQQGKTLENPLHVDNKILPDEKEKVQTEKTLENNPLHVGREILPDEKEKVLTGKTLENNLLRAGEEILTDEKESVQKEKTQTTTPPPSSNSFNDLLKTKKSSIFDDDDDDDDLFRPNFGANKTTKPVEVSKVVSLPAKTNNNDLFLDKNEIDDDDDSDSLFVVSDRKKAPLRESSSNIEVKIIEEPSKTIVAPKTASTSEIPMPFEDDFLSDDSKIVDKKLAIDESSTIKRDSVPDTSNLIETKKVSSLFDDDDVNEANSLFSPIVSSGKGVLTKNIVKKTEPPPSKTKNLFGDDDDDDDDLFS